MTLTRLNILFLLLNILSTVQATKWEATSFCKCICFGSNNVILPLTTPINPSQPCLSCTKQWCLDQKLPICAGASVGDTNPDTATGKEGDVEARCFQRDSPRDQLVVTLFLLTVCGLLLAAGIKTRMLKAGLNGSTIFPWSRQRQEDVRWWEPWFQLNQEENAPLGLSRFGLSATVGQDRRGYAHVESQVLIHAIFPNKWALCARNCLWALCARDCLWALSVRNHPIIQAATPSYLTRRTEAGVVHWTCVRRQRKQRSDESRGLTVGGLSARTPERASWPSSWLNRGKALPPTSSFLPLSCSTDTSCRDKDTI